MWSEYNIPFQTTADFIHSKVSAEICASHQFITLYGRFSSLLLSDVTCMNLSKAPITYTVHPGDPEHFKCI